MIGTWKLYPKPKPVPVSQAQTTVTLLWTKKTNFFQLKNYSTPAKAEPQQDTPKHKKSNIILHWLPKYQRVLPPKCRCLDEVGEYRDIVKSESERIKILKTQ